MAEKTQTIDRELWKGEPNSLEFPITSIARVKPGPQIHPVHGSKTNSRNLNVDPRKNLWYCHACCKGGDSLQLLAVMNRIIGCWEAGPGALTADKFKQTKALAIQLGHVNEPKPSPAKTTKGTPKKDSEPEIPDLATMAQLPDWEVNGHIAVLLRLDKDQQGERLTRFFKVFVEGSEVEGEPLEQNRFLTDTAPSQRILHQQAPSLSDVYNLLRDKLETHLYLTSEVEYDLIALGAVSTYFREPFNTSGYFDFLSAENGAGKTTAMKCLIWSSYYGILMTEPTPAILFRAVDDTRGAVGLDQLDDLFANARENRDILSLLDSAHSKGIFAYRMNMDKSPPEPVA